MLTDDQRLLWGRLDNVMPRRREGYWLSGREVRLLRAVAAHLAALEAEHEAVAATLEAWYQGEQAAGLTPYLIDVERAHKTVDGQEKSS